MTRHTFACFSLGSTDNGPITLLQSAVGMDVKPFHLQIAMAVLRDNWIAHSIRLQGRPLCNLI